MGGKGFKNLRVWQKAKALAVDVYTKTETGKLARDFGLRDQIRRSAVSIASNIAEGDERNSDRESIRFFNIAKGSLAELTTQLEIAHEVTYIDTETMSTLSADCVEIGKMLGKLIQVRSAKTS